jgi:hypothetical protein
MHNSKGLSVSTDCKLGTEDEINSIRITQGDDQVWPYHKFQKEEFYELNHTLKYGTSAKKIIKAYCKTLEI